MKINKKMFRKRINYLASNIANNVMVDLLNSEIKPVNCGGCQYFDEEPINHCLSCTQNDDFIDNYKPKQNELDNLFIGAPVMAEYRNKQRVATYEGMDSKSKFMIYFDGNIDIDNVNTVRLPTVDEAPRNVWLSPWLEMPEELSNESILIWTKSNEIATYHNPSFPDFAWVNAIKIMILED